MVGLGNPGPQYAGTRHNVGFLVAERLADRWSLKETKGLCRARVAEGMVEGHPVRVAQPLGWMNGSGEVIGCLARRWKLDPTVLLVVCDDLSLPLGTVRLRGQGSAGGHQGLNSVLEAMSTDQVPRLRVGIRTQEDVEEMTAFVLGRFRKAEGKRLEEGLNSAVLACEAWVTQGPAAAMNRFNKKVRTEKR